MIDITTVTERTVLPPASKPIPPAPSVWQWAYVTGVSPLRVRFERDTDELPATPSTLVPAGDLIPGDKVWTQTLNGVVLVLGRGLGVGSPLARLSPQISGGGVRSMSAAGVSWDTRFIWITGGKNTRATVGFWDAAMPPDGTVIPVYGHTSRTTLTVTGGAIPLQAWDSLWYEPPLGGTSTSDPSRFRIMNYVANFTPPPTWLHLCTYNMDSPPMIKWADGRETMAWFAPTLTNSWSNYGSGYSPAGLRRENGIVYSQGLIKSGTLGSGGAFALPAGYRPNGSIQWTSMASAGVADLRILSNVFCVFALVSGSTASVSIQGSWPADG